MSKQINSVYLIVGLVLVLLYSEAILLFATIGTITFSGFVLRLLFSIPIALVIFLLSTLAARKKVRVVLPVLLLATAFIYASQMTYFRVFKTFYSLYSAGKASQILEFWKETLMFMFTNTHWLLLLFLPGALLLWFRNRVSYSLHPSWASRLLMALLLAFTHFLGVVYINLGDRSVNSAYDLYHQSTYPVGSVYNFGLLTTMRLDLQRALSGWSPTIELPEPPVAAPSPDSREYNVLDLDFELLLARETEEKYQELHKYFAHVQATAKNEYTGLYEGYNLVFVIAESFAPYAVKPDVTPTLYKLVNEGFVFSEFYVPYWGVSTSDGEYVALQGLIPRSGVWSTFMSSENYLPFTLGNQLRRLGYKTAAYHNHDYDFYRRHISHPNMGYEFKAIGQGLELTSAWPASDLEMMEQTVHEFIDDQPFHVYYLTVSGHHQYNFRFNDMAIKNHHLVADLPYSTQAKAYLATQIELDRAMEFLLLQLEEAGIADNTLIVLSADHYPYALSQSAVEELAGRPLEEHFEIYKSSLVIYAEGMERQVIDKPCSSLDILPTLSNLLGLEYDSRLLMGTDIFSDADPLVVFVDSSFITDKGRYNSWTGEFIPNPGVEVGEDYVEDIIRIIRCKFHFSARMLELDYYRHILGRP